MNGYRVSLKEQWWDHLDSLQLGAKVQELARLGMVFTVSREESPPPKPEVRIIHAPPEIRNVYPCLHQGCGYSTTSIGGLKTHQRVHAK